MTTYNTLIKEHNKNKEDINLISNNKAYIEDFAIQIPEVDDTARIQRAIDSLPQVTPYGGIVEFANKTYTITTLNLTNKKGIKLRGIKGVTIRGIEISQPTATKIFVTGANSYGFDCTDSDGITFEEMLVQGDTIEGKIPRTLFYFSRSAPNKYVNGIRMRDIETGGYVTDYILCLFNAERNSFTDCVFEGSSPKAIVGLLYSDDTLESPFVGSYNSNVSTTVNNFNQCEFINYARLGWNKTACCVHIQGGQLNTAFRDCYVVNNGSKEGVVLKPVVFLIDNSNANFDGNLIIENVRQETSGFGGSFIKNTDTTKECNGISIRDCMIKDDSGVGEILFTCVCKNITIDNVLIFNESINKFTFKDLYNSNIKLPISNNLIVTGQINSSIIHGHTNTISALTGRIDLRTVIYSLDQINLGNMVKLDTLTKRLNFTSSSILNLPSVAPSAPQGGDIWRDGASIKFYDGTTTKTISLN